MRNRFRPLPIEVFNNSFGFFLDFGGDSIDFDVCSIVDLAVELRENYTLSVRENAI